MKNAFKFLSEVFFPVSYTCDLCGVETFGSCICNSCKEKVSFNDGIVCPLCGRKFVLPEICLECKMYPPLFRRAVSPLLYEGDTIKLIHKFKNGGAYLNEYFADLIADEMFEIPKPNCIVYVPMTKSAIRKRGYNQSQLLAQSVSEKTNIPLIENALIKHKETPEQKTLSLKERGKNLAKCFKVDKRNEIKDKNVLIIDDILTTGATANAIGKKLLDAGAARFYLATVASVQYKYEYI